MMCPAKVRRRPKRHSWRYMGRIGMGLNVVRHYQCDDCQKEKFK